MDVGLIEVIVFSHVGVSALPVDLCYFLYVNVFFFGVCLLMFSLDDNKSFSQMSYCMLYLGGHPQLVCILSSPWLCSLCSKKLSGLPMCTALALLVDFPHICSC